MRTHDAGKIRVEALAVHLAHNLLQDDRHLFLFQAVGRGAHVGLGVLAERGSVNALDRL